MDWQKSILQKDITYYFKYWEFSGIFTIHDHIFDNSIQLNIKFTMYMNISYYPILCIYIYIYIYICVCVYIYMYIYMYIYINFGFFVYSKIVATHAHAGHTFMVKFWQVSNIVLKRNYQRCSIKKAVLKNLAILLAKHLCWSLFLINLQAYKPATLLQRDSNTVVFLWVLRSF